MRDKIAKILENSYCPEGKIIYDVANQILALFPEPKEPEKGIEKLDIEEIVNIKNSRIIYPVRLVGKVNDLIDHINKLEEE